MNHSDFRPHMTIHRQQNYPLKYFWMFFKSFLQISASRYIALWWEQFHSNLPSIRIIYYCFPCLQVDCWQLCNKFQQTKKFWTSSCNIFDCFAAENCNLKHFLLNTVTLQLSFPLTIISIPFESVPHMSFQCYFSSCGLSLFLPSATP